MKLHALQPESAPHCSAPLLVDAPGEGASAARRLLHILAVPLMMLGLVGVAVASPKVNVHVELDTTSLLSGITGPYALDFQLIDGDGIANAGVSITNFDFAGGGAALAPDFVGGAAGSVTSGFTLSDSSFFNALILGFDSGATLSFDLSFSAPVTVAGVPDRLTFALLDGTLLEIPTTGAGNELIGIDLRDPLVIETFTGVNNGIDPNLAEPFIVITSTVPEPPAPGLFCVGLLGVMLARLAAARKLSPAEPAGSLA